MKIMFFCRSFHNMAGGVERQATYIMNEMVRRGHDVHLVTWDLADAKAFYDMADRIVWNKMNLGDFNLRAGFMMRLKRLLFIRKTVADVKPDVVIGFQHGAFFMPRIACIEKNIPMIAAERNAVSLFDYATGGKTKEFVFQTLRLATKITVQLKSYVNDYPEYLRSRIAVISNPVFPAKHFAAPAGKEGSPRIILTVGRLSYQKNIDTLVRAFAKIAERFPHWNLVIAGEGEHRNNIEKAVSEHSLEDRVVLMGAVKDVPALYASAHLFCLSARWEGFPNVVAESLSHGLPVVGYRDCAGVTDLVEDGVTGRLADGNGDIDTLADALAELMADDVKREEMGKAAVESMKQYAPDKMFDLWENLFKSLAEKV